MADPKLINSVYFHKGTCSCRACGLEWKSHVLQPCPRCNETSLHAEAVKLQEKVEEYDASFELYDSAVRRGSIHWKNAPGHPEKIWPDTAELVAWMADEIDRLQREICTCPWPEDAAKTRHLLSCRLMQMEHEEARAKARKNDPTTPQQHPDNGGVT